MASNARKKTTMAKLNRERKLRERRQEKQAKKEARKQASEDGLRSASELPTDADSFQPGVDPDALETVAEDRAES